MLIKKWQLTVALSLFTINILIGLIAGISWLTVLYRALGWSFLLLCIMVCLDLLTTNILNSLVSDQTEEGQLDITIPAEDISVKNSPESGGIRQIDDDIEEMVRKNPERVAELTRRMGLD